MEIRIGNFLPILWTICFISLFFTANAQVDNAKPVAPLDSSHSITSTGNSPIQDVDELDGNDQPTTSNETYSKAARPRTKFDLIRELSLYVLGFGVIVMGLMIYIIRRDHIEKDNIVRVLLVTLIVISTLFLITAGFSNDQIAPAVGLLGTIAGYLLGKSNSAV